MQLQRPSRLAPGTAGKSIKLRTNFLPILSLPSGKIIKYEISIVPSIHIAKNRNIYKIWEDECFRLGSLGESRPVYDGKSTVYSPRTIPLIDDLQEFVVEYYEEGNHGIKDSCTDPKRTPKQYCLTLKKLHEIDMHDLTDYLNGKRRDPPLDAIDIMDVLLKHQPSSLYTTIGRCFYTPDSANSIANGGELWQGFHQSIKSTTGSMLINLDVSASTFYEPGPLLKLAAKTLGSSSVENLRYQLSERERSQIEKMIIGLKVSVNHRGPYRKRFKIIGITNTSADKTMFLKNNDGEEQSVSDYFLKRYSVKIRFGHLPCAIYQDGSRPAYLPLEICDVIQGQRYLRKLNERQTSDMIKFTCQPPHIRSNKISAGITILHSHDNEYLKNFGVSVSQEMMMVNARVLDAPTISYHPASKESQFIPNGGSWNLKEKLVAQGMSLVSWAVLSFASEDEYPLHIIQKFVSTLVLTFEECGVFVANPKPPISYANPYGNIQRILTDSYIVAGDSYNTRPQIVFCILPNTGVPLYAEIKRVSDTVLGITTQCVQVKHILACKRQYCANVCLKVNVKLGGMNSFLSTSELPFVSEKPTLILGADVTHPAPGSSSSQSIAALVGSLDAQCARYTSSIRIQKGRLEVIEDLTEMILEILQMFLVKCGTKPERIIMYRDGISEGRFYEISTIELQSIKKACSSLDPSYSPKITFIAIQKRHHARFFPVQNCDSDKSGNILPGTVIESGITHPFEFDFYLASHPGLQGTSKPTYYHVLHDENFIQSDVLQAFTYRLCYLYCRATRSVSVVPPAYYAHIVAARARFHAFGESWNEDGIVAQAMKRGLRTSPSGYFNELGNGRVMQYGEVKEELKDIMYFM